MDFNYLTCDKKLFSDIQDFTKRPTKNGWYCAYWMGPSSLLKKLHDNNWPRNDYDLMYYYNGIWYSDIEMTDPEYRSMSWFGLNVNPQENK